MSKLFWPLFPVIAGLCQPFIWAATLRLSRHTGAMEASMLLHVVGALMGSALMIVGLRGSPGLSGMGSAPWWAFLGGAVGVTLMAGLNRAVPVVGVALATALMVASQLSFSLLFEHYGWMELPRNPATLSRGLGVIFLVLGAFLVSRTPA